jgi:hypothetical protein
MAITTGNIITSSIFDCVYGCSSICGENITYNEKFVPIVGREANVGQVVKGIPLQKYKLQNLSNGTHYFCFRYYPREVANGQKIKTRFYGCGGANFSQLHYGCTLYNSSGNQCFKINFMNRYDNDNFRDIEMGGTYGAGALTGGDIFACNHYWACAIVNITNCNALVDNYDSLVFYIDGQGIASVNEPIKEALFVSLDPGIIDSNTYTSCVRRAVPENQKIVTTDWVSKYGTDWNNCFEGVNIFNGSWSNNNNIRVPVGSNGQLTAI